MLQHPAPGAANSKPAHRVIQLPDGPQTAKMTRFIADHQEQQVTA
jgi:hypothetical protein